MLKRLLVPVVLIFLIVVGAGIYLYINQNSILEFDNMGESVHWRVAGHIQKNKEVVIFRPVLYLKFSSDEPLEVEVRWNLDENLSYSNTNSPQLQNSYTFTSYQAANMIDIPLQNFNFTNANKNEVIKLLTRSSIEIKLKQGDSEEIKEVINFDANR